MIRFSNLRYNSILYFEQNMGNMAEGQVYTCSECGLELKVTKPCDEEDCDLIEKIFVFVIKNKKSVLDVL